MRGRMATAAPPATRDASRAATMGEHDDTRHSCASRSHPTRHTEGTLTELLA